MGRNRFLPLCLLAGTIGLLAAADTRGDLIFLKDGTVLQGKVSREGKTIADPHSGQAVWMPQGFFWVDDGARRVAFSPGQVQEVQGREYNAEHDIHSPRVVVGRKWLPALVEIVSVGPFDEKWDRKVVVRCTDGKVNAEIALPTQHLSTLTPHYARLDLSGYGYRWTCCYLTQELGPEQVRALIASHPEFKEEPGMPEGVIAAKRFRVFHFLVQAGWYDHAEKELEGILKDLPGEKEKVETAREGLKRLRAQQRVDDIRRAQGAGQHRLAQKLLATLPEEGVPEKTLAEVRALRDQYEKTTENLKQARRFLEELSKGVSESSSRELFAAAVRAISEELDHDNVGRLEPFLSQAAQAERQRRQGTEPDHDPAELLSLAVSGWLLGGTLAEAKVPVAERLWRAREFVLKYQTTTDRDDRRRMLGEYLKGEPIGVDEMAQLITTLPPPEPEEKVEPTPVKLHPRESGTGRGAAYYVQPPPEYHHGRPFPVLMVLHQGGESARAMLDRWSAHAARNGYLLVAPEWGQGLKTTYSYTSQEHAVVLDTLRDLRRRYNVDSDRVFLHGWGEGGTMAYDIGLAHPDLFAGVVPMGGRPVYYAQRYRRNAQYLPFYVISGDHSGLPHAENRQQFEDWVPKGHPAILVEYRGRGREFFAAELPLVFEWMKHKKRAMPVAELGGYGREFQTMRSTDNMFYWVSTDSINPGNLNDGRWDSRVLAATLWGYVNRENNAIHLRTVGLRQLSVWLGRDSKGVGMIDFGAPVTVVINGQTRMIARVTPSMETLLEDLYHRSDRQRVFLVRLDFNKV
ncbi:MAG TPA: hypothetical protein VNK04_09010 [Gemmataceae bacterium]|nr:hypothetical protein [Gemmataceae bacterium]